MAPGWVLHRQDGSLKDAQQQAAIEALGRKLAGALAKLNA
jgi:hypothetical protein